MITDERISSYIRSLEKDNDDIIKEIEEYAILNRVPIIRKEMESYLRVMVNIVNPDRILEIGTAIGYSAIIMSTAMNENCTITTIENYDKRIPVARKNFEITGNADRITLIEGDAMEVLRELEGSFDMVFMDAAKAQYVNYLPEVTRLLRSGGILITDNVFMDGDILDSRYGVIRRDRTIHARMREYMNLIKNHPDYETTIIPIGDGITLSVKKGVY